MFRIIGDLLSDIFELQEFIAKEDDYYAIVQKVARLAMKVSNSDICFFYNIDSNGYLSLDYSVNESLNIAKTGIDNLIYFPVVKLSDLRHKIKKSAVERCALNKEVLNLSHIYINTDLDNSFFEKYDNDNSYMTSSVLTIPLINRQEEVISVIQFVNAKDYHGKPVAFNKDMQRASIFLCSLLAYLIENRKLRESYGHLLESFIEVIARAIDAKSPYTASHCQHVPVITRMLATAAVEEETGPLSDFEMSSEEWYSLHIASWLHDCGKLTTPEYIVDKATKLETVSNRIHEIRNRFEILRRDAHIDYLKKRLKDVDTKENLQAEFVAKVRKIEDDFDFVARCNIGDNTLTDEDIERLENISKIKFKRYFSRMKGLSWAERDNISNHELYSKPSMENLLQNREDHLVGMYNRGELYNLMIRKGTITAEERAKINEHIEITIDLLKILPFPKELSNVIEYAGSHHERMDGKGYPNGLTGCEMSIPARIIAISDIFEALTATDRPYKGTKTLSQVLEIMKEMKNTGHIDPDLYRVFINNKVYLEYAKQYMKPEQVDDVNPGDYL